MKKLFLFLLLLFSLVLTPSVLSWGPNYHYNITMDALAQAKDSLIKQTIENNMDGCLSGLSYPDVGIFYYYTDFKEYAGLHNYNIVDEMLRIATNDQQRAFAYCYKIHLAEDAVSHNYIVPQAIRQYKLPNYVVHPIVELKLEGLRLNPIANRLMERHTMFDEFFAQASGKDWSTDAEKLNTVIGGGNFYAKGFTPGESGTWWAGLQNGFYSFLGNFVSDKSVIDYYKLSLNEAILVIEGQTGSLDPSGEISLKQADSDSSLLTYLFSIGLIIAIFLISWKFKLI
jgi:hypothetical protein